MEHYVTLFDAGFLPQGLALNQSLERQESDYTLWVLCIDTDSYDLLSRLALSNVRLIRLDDVETPELALIKSERSRAEYCWTLTPFAPKFVFDADSSVKRVTYVDADVWLLRSPRPIFKEFACSGKAVLITEHAYAPEYDLGEYRGRFCVQFIIFDRIEGEPVRQWWAQRCLEWCYNRYEDGKFGDQMYLDTWLEMFGERVHIMKHRGWALAPWNATRFPVNEAVFYHFHGLRIVNQRLAFLGAFYATPRTVFNEAYLKYLHDLRGAITALSGLGFQVLSQRSISRKLRLAIILRRIMKPFLSAGRRDTISRYVKID